MRVQTHEELSHTKELICSTVYRNMKNNADRAKEPESVVVTGEMSFAEGNTK